MSSACLRDQKKRETNSDLWLQVTCDGTPLIGSPHCLNSEFTFYMHSEQYPNITTHFRISVHIFAAYFASSQLIRTSEVYFGNFGSISDLRSLFWKLRTYFGPPKFISETSDLFRTSEVYFGNFAPLSDLRRLFQKLRTSSTCIPTFRPPIRTTSMIYDLVSSSPLFIFSHIYVLNVL
jgi:hypothetical protein